MSIDRLKNKYPYQVTEISIPDYELLWKNVPKANVIQAWQYGVAKEKTDGWKVVRFMISDLSGKPIAISQWLTRTLPIFGGIARLNRGPLLLEEKSSDEAIKIGLEILRSLIREAKKRRWWVVQIAPEFPDSEIVKKVLLDLKFKQRSQIPWASSIINLNENEQDLLMRINGKWRNCMRKGERLGVSVELVTPNADNLGSLLISYSSLQGTRGFKGLSHSLIKNLANQVGENWSFNLFEAYESIGTIDRNPIGHLVSVRHGDSSTYMIGSTNEKGRQMQANSVLLWKAILHAKHIGCNWFDLGGLNAATPQGIAEFKKSLNGVPYGLVGEWRGYLLPL